MDQLTRIATAKIALLLPENYRPQNGSHFEHWSQIVANFNDKILIRRSLYHNFRERVGQRV
jgi:hypothetical protein